MFFIDIILLSFGCIISGFIAAAPLILRTFPSLSPAIYHIMPLKTAIGITTVIAGLLSLLFPYHGPIIMGNLIPGFFGIFTGLFLCLQYFADKKSSIDDKILIVWIGNVLTYLRIPIGLVSLFSGFLHLFSPQVLFF